MMARATEPAPVKLICGMVSSDTRWFAEAVERLGDRFGEADLVSDVVDFDFTHYYDAEMGSPLYRQFASFADEVAPDVLVDAKLATNAIEGDFAARSAGRPVRPINLDPGYVEPSKLVLASMKNFSHRIYLGRGVYAEVTLLYQKGRWTPLPWTFPDYASPRYHDFLDQVRARLRKEKRA